MKKVILIAGSRDYIDDLAIKYNIRDIFKEQNIHPDNVKIISGGARGVDSIAEKFAIENGYEFEAILPDWKKYGKAAGFIRNKIMVDMCDFAIIFWTGKSKGTKHTIDILNKQAKPHVITLVINTP